jgi:crotonobetainyl-CoA:carnitine CoA-transferase CaiB-like acyl-CoA transferase
LSLTPGRIRHAGLELGACTDEVLTQLGYSDQEIDRLRAGGAVGSPQPLPLAVA